MKKILRVSLISVFLIPLSGCSLLQPNTRKVRAVPEKAVPYYARNGESLRKRIMVLPFLDDVKRSSLNVKEVGRETLVQEMIKTGNFVVIRNSDFPKPIHKFLTHSQDYDLEEVAKTASKLGVSAIIEGKIIEIKARRLGDQVGVFRKLRARVDAKIRIRVVSAKNGKLILDEVRTGTIEDQITRVGEYSYSDRFLSEDPRLVRAVVKKAFGSSLWNIYRSVEKLSWEGRVAMVSGERIFINAGRLSGLQIGDILKVTEDGQEVFDPVKGTFIGNAPGRMKGTVEITSYFGKDGAIAIVHSGSGFHENDRVELY